MILLELKAVKSVILMALLSSCASSSPSEHQDNSTTHLYDRHIEQAKHDVLEYLHVQDGLFSGLNTSKSPAGEVVVCGWVRKQDHKFSYPRYPINQPFAAQYARTADGSYNISKIHFAADRNQISNVELYCSGRNAAL
jgi:hypothetical protein